MLEQNTHESEFSQYKLGTLYGVKIYVLLHKDDVKTQINVNYLPREIKNEIRQFKRESQKVTLETFSQKTQDNDYELSHNAYYDQIAFEDSTVFHRSISTDPFLRYLFQSLTTKELKEVFRTHDITGYSKLKKDDLIELLILNLSKEEKIDWLRENELKIIKNELQAAINIIYSRSKESISQIQIVNPEHHEIECTFNGQNWETSNFLSITERNIKDPARDCDCRTGANLGFCPHFWVAFLKAYKEGYFDLEDWTLTQLPYAFCLTIDTFISPL